MLLKPDKLISYRQAAAEPTDNFSALVAAGYGSRLLPVVPPDARISERSALAKRKGVLGKAPGERGGDGLWRGLADWINHETTAADVERWRVTGASCGVRTGHGLIAVDSDTMSERLASIVAQAAGDVLGRSWPRIGRAPKLLLPYRCDDDEPYACVKFPGDDGEEERVELLVDGRQFVAAGEHPATGAPYSWPCGLPHHEDLTLVTSAQVQAFFARIGAELPNAKFSRGLLTSAGSVVDPATLAGDPDAVRRAVEALPNTPELYPARADYIRVGQAIKGALPQDEVLAFGLFEHWCDKYGPGNEPETIAADWERLTPARQLGASWLYAQADKHSGGKFHLPQAYFSALPDEAPDPSAPRDEWPEPEDLFGDGDQGHVPQVPRGVFPSTIERWAFDTAERLGVSPAFTIAAATAVIAAAIGTKQRIQPKGQDTGWTEPPILWAALIEEPGGKKSPVLAAASRPLCQLNAQRYAEWRGKHDAWKGARDRARRTKDGPEPGPEPKCERHIVDSFTVEALAGVLADNGAGVLVNADELTGLITSLDQYKAKGNDRQMLLRLADGRNLDVDRVGAGATHVENWGACVLGGIQPKKIKELAATGLDADGLLQRFLLIVGDDNRRPEIDREPDDAVQRDYRSAIEHFARARHLPTTTRLSAGASEVLKKFRKHVEDLRGLPNLSDAWSGHLGKWPGFSARLLLVQHMLECWEISGASGADWKVTEETACRAVRVAKFFLAHSLLFYRTCIGLGPSGDDSRSIARHILAHPSMADLSRRDIGQFDHSLRGNEQSDERKQRAAFLRVTRAMENLERAGWCGPELSGDKNRRYWRVNPKIYASFAKRSEQERARREEIKLRIKHGREAAEQLMDDPLE